MLHRPIVAMALLATLALASPALSATPEASFELGVRAFRAGDYASAVVDLEDAARALTTRDRVQAFVAGGELESLATLETTLVYLALAQFRLGQEDAARATLLRLAAAEEIEPTYAGLRLGAEAAELESLAAALAPEIGLPRNTAGVADDPTAALPPVVPASRRAALTPADRERIARALAPEVLGLAPAPVAIADAPPVAAPPTSSAAPASAPSRVAAPVPPAVTRESLLELRKAEALIDNGLVADANAIYRALVRSETIAREVLIEAATGLYRTGAYRDAVDAFRRFGAFARGEEDLRYYYSVSLFESGDYQGAQREFRCALPFIRETDEVLRYQTKIERMQQAAFTSAMR